MPVDQRRHLKTEREAENWFINRPTELVLCDNCYCRYFKHLNRRQGKFTWGKYGYDLSLEDRKQAHRDRWNPTCNKLHIQFKKTNVYLGWNPKMYVCSKCKRFGRTNMHHMLYYVIFPWFATVELCNNCHRQEHIKKV